MDSFKKNPIFSAVVLLGALVFIAGAVLAFLANTSVGKSKKKFERAEDALNAAYRGRLLHRLLTSKLLHKIYAN